MNDDVDGLAFPSDDDERHTLVLGSERNQIRLPPYDRFDLRLRKVFPFRWGVFTLSGEVLNVLNRKNEYNAEPTLLTVARSLDGLEALASKLRRP